MSTEIPGMTSDQIERFTIEVGGERIIKYGGLLDVAHQSGRLRSLDFEILSMPTKENGYMAIVKSICSIDSKDGSRVQQFKEVAEATASEFEDSELADCLIRIASTRAKARALRDAFNISIVSLEELPGRKQRRLNNGNNFKPDNANDTQYDGNESFRNNTGGITKSQLQAIYRIIDTNGIDLSKVLAYNKVNFLEELTYKEATECIKYLNRRSYHRR